VNGGLRLRTFHVHWALLAGSVAVTLLLCTTAIFVVGPLSMGDPTRFMLGMGLVVATALALVVRNATAVVNVSVDRLGELVVRERLFAGGVVRVRTADVRQIFNLEHTWVEGGSRRDHSNAGHRVYARRLIARLADGRDVTLATGLPTADANALEQALEGFLSIRDVPMVGAKR
jgi:hypothetical protein